MFSRLSPENRLVSEILRLDGPIMRTYRVRRRVWAKIKEEVRATDLKSGSDKDSTDAKS